MTAVPVETCQSVVLRTPWGRPGSVLYTCNRLRRMCGRFHRIYISVQVLSQLLVQSPSPPGFRSRALWRAPSTGACGVGDYPTLDLSRRPPGADLPPKKVCNLGPMAPRSRKKRKLPEAPSSRRSGLVGPHTTPAIVNYKYMTSTS